jgi:Zn-dependent M16 (insulinase) family peptidase
MQVAFCAQVLPAPHVSHPDAALLLVGGHLLSLGYFWEEVRIKGGAYGGGCGYQGFDQEWFMFSYRDPWVKRTLDTFAALREHVAQSAWTRTDIDRAIIGTAKEGERPIRPGEATGAALGRYLCGDTPERREERYAAILRATPEGVKRAMLELLDRNMARGGVCVVSSREKLEQGNREMPAAPLAIEDILK